MPEDRRGEGLVTRMSVCENISLPALQGAGGLLLLLVALQLLVGQESGVSSDAGVNVALVPLGTPILAGPGAIVATMLAVRQADGVGGFLAVARLR